MITALPTVAWAVNANKRARLTIVWDSADRPARMTSTRSWSPLRSLINTAKGLSSNGMSGVAGILNLKNFPSFTRKTLHGPA